MIRTLKLASIPLLKLKYLNNYYSCSFGFELNSLKVVLLNYLHVQSFGVVVIIILCMHLIIFVTHYSQSSRESKKPFCYTVIRSYCVESRQCFYFGLGSSRQLFVLVNVVKLSLLFELIGYVFLHPALF